MKLDEEFWKGLTEKEREKCAASRSPHDEGGRTVVVGYKVLLHPAGYVASHEIALFVKLV
jgi:hypothetical protein